MEARSFSVVSFATALIIALVCLCAALAFPGQVHASPTSQGDGENAALVKGEVSKPALNSQLDTSASSTKPAKPSGKQLKAFKKASADFSLELLNRCVAAKGKSANVTIAPLSVMNALAITANGAKGRTARQMREVIGGGATMAEINQNLSWYNSKLVNTKRAKLRNANAIWYHNGSALKMRKTFLKAAKSFYHANITPADFSDPATVGDINSWVAKQTNNMIKQVIDRLDEQDKLAIVNALYFDAEWANPYEKGSVRKATFHAANGKDRTVKMLYGTEHTYISGKNVTGFMKPYAAGYSYVALLPDEGMSLKEYVATLDGTTFRRLIARATKTTVHTVLPKYSISYSNEDMAKQLAAMGMPLAFLPAADFSKMATCPDGNIYLGKVIHKTKVKLDEKGTKAAAVTAIVAKNTSAYEPDYKTVRLDRPFVYAIVDNTAKLPVFIGTVNDIGK